MNLKERRLLKDKGYINIDELQKIYDKEIEKKK